MVAGSATFEVADVQALLADDAAVKKTKIAVRSALASQLRASLSDITVELSAARRLTTVYQRLQAGSLQVDYTVAVESQAAAESLVSSVKKMSEDTVSQGLLATA